ncbi:hypothetical protein SCP_0508070 [Sparassis crispa]|uniref:Ribonuclease H1 N-terminal domain-containing protein n=1 Tax=Sparassis crispa TaxID=139825 RepID=A0A401GND4_9APHY|nr:hypothetical protein SCP_0508070 [Sparassis crispa]GBE83751.1 hypothetical protein SCP_0508070 [Sparassis crispa]
MEQVTAITLIADIFSNLYAYIDSVVCDVRKHPLLHPKIHLVKGVNKWYVSLYRRDTVIYLTWPECEAQVSGFPGMKHCSFMHLQDVIAFYIDKGDEGVIQPVRPLNMGIGQTPAKPPAMAPSTPSSNHPEGSSQALFY